MFLDNLVLGAGGASLNSGDIIATLVIFIVLMLLLKKFAWGPLMGIMQQREELVASEIKRLKKRAKNRTNFRRTKSLLKEARTEAQSIVEGAKKQGELQKKKFLL